MGRRRVVEEGNEPFRSEEAVALGEKLGDFGPVGAITDDHPDDVGAEPAPEERMTLGEEGIELGAAGPEFHPGDRRRIGVDGSDMSERVLADPPSPAGPRLLLVRLRKAE